jgi:hypothetical protein
MPVPIGISVGDFIATTKLLNNLRNALCEHDGAHVHYQNVIRDLETCDSILACLENFSSAPTESAQANAIRALAHSIRQKFEAFIQENEKYRSSLGSTPTDAKLRRGANKLKWSRTGSKAAARLSEWVNMQMTSIHTLVELDSMYV